MDAAINLVGERLLGVLKTGMGRLRWEEMGRMRIQNKYLKVIGVLQGRGIVVDKSWIGYTVC